MRGFHLPRAIACVGLVLGLLGVTGNPGQAAQLYGVSGDEAPVNAESFFRVSTVDASTTLIQSLVSGTFWEAIAFNSDNGLMYHWSGEDFVQFCPLCPPDGIFSDLTMETVDLNDQTVTNVPLPPFDPMDPSYHPEIVLAATYDPDTGNFFFVDNIQDNLVSVTPDGVYTLIGSIDPPSGNPSGCNKKLCGGLAFNNGKLYVADRNFPKDSSIGLQLHEISPLTAEILTSVKICRPGDCGKGAKPFEGVHSLTTDPDTGILYALVRKLDDTLGLATIDPLTGFATDIGPLPEEFFKIEFGPASDPIDDLIKAINDLLADPSTPAKAENDLLKAIEKLEKAQEKLENGDTAKGIKEMAGAAKKLEKAGKDGAFIMGLVDILVEHARSLANEAADLARPLAGTNAEVDQKLAKMEAKLIKAEGEVAAGDFDKAIKEFAAAVKEADKAIEAATSP